MRSFACGVGFCHFNVPVMKDRLFRDPVSVYDSNDQRNPKSNGTISPFIRLSKDFARWQQKQSTPHQRDWEINQPIIPFRAITSHKTWHKILVWGFFCRRSKMAHPSLIRFLKIDEELKFEVFFNPICLTFVAERPFQNSSWSHNSS